MNFIKRFIKEKDESESNNVFCIVKGAIVAIILTIISLLIYSEILNVTTIGENTINYVVTGISAISIFIGSIISVSKIKKKGIVNGAFVGGIYIIVIYLLSSIINSNFDVNISSIILIVSSIIAGIVGGIIGVNIKK